MLTCPATVGTRHKKLLPAQPAAHLCPGRGLRQARIALLRAPAKPCSCLHWRCANGAEWGVIDAAPLGCSLGPGLHCGCARVPRECLPRTQALQLPAMWMQCSWPEALFDVCRSNTPLARFPLGLRSVSARCADIAMRTCSLHAVRRIVGTVEASLACMPATNSSARAFRLTRSRRRRCGRLGCT